MNRAANALVAALLVAGLATGTAFAATPPWQSVAGHFKTKAAASTQITKLKAKGLSGYRIETEKSGQFSKGKKYEVEKAYNTQKSARAAAAKLKKAGYTASTENEKTE